MWCLLRTIGAVEDGELLWIVENPYENLPRNNSGAAYVCGEPIVNLTWVEALPHPVVNYKWRSFLQEGWDYPLATQ